MSADSITKPPGLVLSPEEVEKRAKKELNEDPKRRQADLEHLRNWINQQPHLGRNARQDDRFLLHFLRGCKFSLERTKEKIENWNTFRAMLPEFYANWDPKDPIQEEIIKLGIMVPLPGYDRHGRKVLLQRLGLVDPDRHNAEDLQKVIYMITDCFMRHDDFQADVCGVVVISDAVGTTTAHLKNYSPAMGKKMITVYEEAFPSRPKEFHMMNIPSFAETLFNMFKGFMKEKMRERIQVHKKGDLKKLQKNLGCEVLPPEYGGTNLSVNEIAKLVTAEVMESRDWLIAQMDCKADESKRVGLKKNYSELFGMVGSFRKLELD